MIRLLSFGWIRILTYLIRGTSAMNQAKVHQIAIGAILPYHGDTLLIHGNIGKGVITSLFPFGQAETHTRPNRKASFFALYSAPEILSSIPPICEMRTFNLTPNPANRYLPISNLQNHQTLRIESLTPPIHF